MTMTPKQLEDAVRDLRQQVKDLKDAQAAPVRRGLTGTGLVTVKDGSITQVAPHTDAPVIGDMTKAVYDTDDDGIVDGAEQLDDGTNTCSIAQAKAFVDPFGTGADGDVTISGTTTLTRNMFYDDLTIASGGILIPKGWKVFVKGVLTVQNGGKITAAGADGSEGSKSGGSYTLGAGGDGGNYYTSTPYQDIGKGGRGGRGGFVATAGSNGEAITCCMGKRGGGGGGGATCTHGIAGTAGGNAGVLSSYASMWVISVGERRSGNDIINVSSGGGGGGGGGDTDGGMGGGGGGGGGWLDIFARTIVVGSTGVITAAGGAGANGIPQPERGFGSAGGGGGGGGGGGIIFLVYESLTSSGTISVAGGAGGSSTGDPPGSPGSAGTNGVLVKYNVSTQAYE